MKIALEEIMEYPYKLTLELTETELADLQDIMHTVSILAHQFTDDQRNRAAQIDNRISAIWRD